MPELLEVLETKGKNYRNTPFWRLMDKKERHVLNVGKRYAAL